MEVVLIVRRAGCARALAQISNLDRRNMIAVKFTDSYLRFRALAL